MRDCHLRATISIERVHVVINKPKSVLSIQNPKGANLH
jgi:hypothetical protein